ncbi:MAG: SPFH domain-containing protein [Oscillospiraceae bacterium]|nr:SPFH domain-containing protein [Oscillospiraceae bacterium]
MSKFVIECPHCGRYAEAKTGFWAKRKIDCSCGFVIDVHTDKLASRVCPHCGNNVVFDQSKGVAAKCPVCGEPINTMAEQDKTVEFSCEQCGIRLRTTKGATTYTCPVCDHVNDVAERVKSEEIRKDGLASIIKYEGDNDTLVWKHPIEDFNLGSQLIVHESQEAIFFRDGQALDLFSAGRYTLETQQLPLLEKLYKLPTDTEGTFHSEVYFINLATQMGIKWGTDSKVRLFDPTSGLHVELGASGEFNIKVVDSRKLLLKVVGTTGGLSQEQLLGGNGKGFFRAMVMTQVKSFLAQTIRENSISVLAIDERLMELSEALRVCVNKNLADYGLEMPEFYVSRIVTPDDDPNFRRMKEQYAAQYLLVREEEIKRKEAEAAAARRAVEAEADARVKVIGAQGEAEALKIQRQAEADAYRMQAEAEALEMKMKGYTYEQETARRVGMEAMKNGIAGEGGSALGDIAGLGVTLGAMGGVIGMTREAMEPVMESMQPVTPANTWNCSCGRKDISSRFCPDCGSPRPAPADVEPWDCPECGAKHIRSRFCPECGCKRPVTETWDCPKCGTKGIASKFCPECGEKRGE